MMRLHTGCTEKDLLPKIVTMIERICVDAPEKTFLTADQQSEETHLCTTTNRERRCNYWFTMCKKKTTAQRATVSFFSSQPQAVTTINPNLQLPPMVVTTSFSQRKYSHNGTCQIDTQYTAHSIHQKWTLFWKKFQEKTCGCVCPQRCARITG